MSDKELHDNPKFWAVFALIWAGGVLGVMNIAMKINMLLSIASNS